MKTVTRTYGRARLHSLIAAVVLLAIAAAGLALVSVARAPAPQPWQLGLLLAMLPLSELALLHVRLGGEQYSFTWGEAAVLVGFVLVSPAWFVLAAGPLVLAVHLASGRAPLKSLYNASSFTVSAAVGWAVLAARPRTSYQLFVGRDLAWLLAAVVVFSATSAVLTSAVVATATSRTLALVLVESARMSVLVLVGNVACAVTFLGLEERDRATMWSMIPVLLLVFVGYRVYLSAGKERDAWQQLEASARELNKLDEAEVAAAALTRAQQMFRTDGVVLALSERGDRPDRLYAMVDGQLSCEPDRGEARAPFVELVLGGGRSAPSPCVVAPLNGPTGRLGSLRLSFDAPVRLSSRERQVLSTYAHAVSNTLLNAYLYDDVCGEAARQAYEASHDPLTGLANRLLLAGRSASALAEAKGTTAMLLLDLDHFKEINDTLGHAAGDLLLQEVARRLQCSVREEDLVVRLGGDEFAILLTDLSSPAAAEPVAAAVLALLSEPVEYQGLHLSVEASIGIACYPDDAATSEELFRRADVAMYQAKHERGAWLRYDPLRDDTSVQRLALVGELRAALEDELVVHFQPKVDLVTGVIIGAEALVRWNHPTRGLLQPGEFVAVAEQSGLVRPFTLRVLDMAVAECVTWQTPNRPLSVAVNLGARSLMDLQLPLDVAAVLARHGLPASQLVLEITETTATSELEVVEEVLGHLRRLGVEISVDDFGTGYSSLAFLQRTAVHELKVDRSFVAGMLVNDNDLALVRATVHLAHSLGARAVAEGVESQELQESLRQLGCDVAQGYHLGRPMPGEQYRALLATRFIPEARVGGDELLPPVRTLRLG
ncbi:MAG: diguanylate cyclase [Frankiales bacterium]|nr:diguanylate cyclase [Frankiales bacterium]